MTRIEWIAPALWLSTPWRLTAAIDATDAIRMWRNDRRDARDVKRGVL